MSAARNQVRLVDDEGQTLAYHSMRTEHTRGAEMRVCGAWALAVSNCQKAGVL